MCVRACIKGFIKHNGAFQVEEWCVASLSVLVTRAADHELMNPVGNVKAGPRSLCEGSAVQYCQH